MTPRTSLRAAARDIYGELAKGHPPSLRFGGQAPTPDPSPRIASARGGGEQTDLTARVRALYEGSAVPVRAIARLVGVSERTIYKYVAKGGWKRRHACPARDRAVAAAHRGRRSGPASGFKPARGAGGRFIRHADLPHDDLGQPFAQGLKATDPAGRARAAAACMRAQALADLAQARAQADKRHDALLRAIDGTTRAFAILRKIRHKAAGRRRMKPPYALLERVAIRHVEVALGRWQWIAARVTAC